MNAPNRFEMFTLADGERLIEVIEDTKIPNAATFKVVKLCSKKMSCIVS
ncbi:hypothetical protein RSAG8_06479, partial [Rhizoctonia solani AG-8 WAC10335]